MTTESMKKPEWMKRMAPLDYLALVGGIINVVVISAIIGFWLIR